jgi:nucleoside-diphosphate-sugar epimerase
MYTIIENDCKQVIKNINIKKFKNKSILITGATGLIGVYIVTALKQIQQSNNINIWCWFKNCIDPNFKEIFKDCNLIQSDIANPMSFTSLPEFDYIVHCAGYAQPTKFLEDKIKTLTINTSATINLFNILKPTGTFLYISSSEIYSGLNLPNMNETQIGSTTTDHPRACYIEGKRTGETICHIFSEKGIDVKIARVSMVYGPGIKKNDKRVISTFIEKGLNQDEIALIDDGSAQRVICYISDAIEMIFNILFHSKDITYNVTGITNTTIFNLAKSIGSILDKPVKIPTTYNTGMQGNPKTVSVAITKYLNEFKKDKFIDLKQGLKQTIDWYKQLL